MALELNIKPEDIERLVKDSIMNAGFGAAITKAVSAAMSGYNNPVDDAIKRYVGQVAAELVREKFADQVRQAVSAAIEQKVTAQLIETVVAQATDKMVAAVDRY